MSDRQPLFDPQDLVSTVQGVLLGVLLMVGFYVLAVGMDLTTFVQHDLIPYQ